jgi:uncharacterized membrane protein HdeD (DUF308 family)
MKLLGICLIVFGVLALVYHGFSIAIPKDTLDLGFLSISTRENRTIPLPPLLGIVSVVAGVLLVYTARR